MSPLTVGFPGERVIPVARNLDVSRAIALADALRAGGLTMLEVTVEGEGAMEAISAIGNGPTVVGAGTIKTIDEADRAVSAGARFLMSPHLDPDLVHWARAAEIPYVPGVLTPTEVARAIHFGVETVKLFPASLGGPGMVAALLGPFPGLKIIPTGGVDATNARSYLDSGAIAVGVGGWLTAPTSLKLVTDRARALVAVV